MNNILRVKPAEIGMLTQIFAIEKECFTDPWTVNMLREVIADQEENTSVVCFLNDQIIGFAFLWVYKEIKEAHIENIAVKPDFRGFGAGETMLVHLLDVCRKKGVATVFLELRKSNTIAQKMYEKHGFVANGLRKEYYTKPKEDAILMNKVLEDGNEKA